MANKYPWNTDELINENDMEFPDRDKERTRRRNRKGWTKAKRRKEVADRHGIEVKGGLHRFVDNKIGDILQPNNQRKLRSYLKKHSPSLDEMKVDEASKVTIDDYYMEEEEPMYEFDPDQELLY